MSVNMALRELGRAFASLKKITRHPNQGHIALIQGTVRKSSSFTYVPDTASASLGE